MNRCDGALGILTDTDGTRKAFMAGGTIKANNRNGLA